MRKAHGPVAVLAALAGARRHAGARARGGGVQEGAGRGHEVRECQLVRTPNHTPVHHTHLLKRWPLSALSMGGPPVSVVASSVPLGLQQERLGEGQGHDGAPGVGSNAMLSLPSPIAGERFHKN